MHLTRSVMRQTSLFLTKAYPTPKAFECNSFILPIAFLTVNIDRMFSLHILKTMRLIAFRRILETYRKHISNELVVWHLWWKTAGILRQYLPLQFETLILTTSVDVAALQRGTFPHYSSTELSINNDSRNRNIHCKKVTSTCFICRLWKSKTS